MHVLKVVVRCFVWPGNHSTLICYMDPLSHRLGCNNNCQLHFGVWFRLEETVNICNGLEGWKLVSVILKFIILKQNSISTEQQNDKQN